MNVAYAIPALSVVSLAETIDEKGGGVVDIATLVNAEVVIARTVGDLLEVAKLVIVGHSAELATQALQPETLGDDVQAGRQIKRRVSILA